MSRRDFRARMLAGAPLAGTFVKTPAHEVIEVLAQSELDFLCLDAEHSPFDRARMDLCLAIGNALDMPMLVRVPSSSPSDILQALDSGADGIVVPHVDTAAQAQAAARAARFGRGGRGYAGSSRWAGFATRSMADNLAASRDTIVIAQIESPEALEACEDIAATDGIDGLFLGPGDLTVAYGLADQTAPEVAAATARVGAAAAAQGLACMTFIARAEQVAALRGVGYSMFFVASEHTWMRQGASAAATAVHGSDDDG